MTLTRRMLSDCEERDTRFLLDLGFQIARYGLYSLRGAPRFLRTHVTVYGCIADETAPLPEPVFSNLYDGVFEMLEELPEEVRSDALFLGELGAWGDVREALGLLLSFMELFRTVYCLVPRPDTPEGEAWLPVRSFEGLSAEYAGVSGTMALIRAQKKVAVEDIKLFVAAHKNAQFPSDDIYVPLWLGKPEDNKNGYTDDKKEPSIAYLNPRINECTGLYHIWKHETAEITGLVHYRRLFLNDRQMDGKRMLIERADILEYLSRYDILVYQLECFSAPLREQLVTSGISAENSNRALKVFERLIVEKQPDYADAFERVMGGCAFYPCNMLIARKPVFDAYCEWLFSFLIDAANELDFDAFDDANRRTAGFLAERMLTVWLLQQDLRIRELEVTRV